MAVAEMVKPSTLSARASTQMKILKIIKLGEGFFDVFRSGTIIIFQNEIPDKEHIVKCFTLMKKDRKRVIEGEINLSELEEEKGILIPQQRFVVNEGYAFDITKSSEDVEIMKLMENNTIDWEKLTETGRGVEFSESGNVIQCPSCFKWDNPPRKRKGQYRKKICRHCGFEYAYEKALAKDTIVLDTKRNENDVAFVLGLGINRYYVSDIKYLDVNKEGINYKKPSLYQGAKLLIRKTGVGIYATIDYFNCYVPQAVFIFKMKEELPDEYQEYKLEYILGVINSRLMLYYYYKKFGELEWKSFPYITQKTIKQLPLRKINFSNPVENKIRTDIIQKVREILKQSTNKKVSKELDYDIENLIMKLYKITPNMKMHIWNELKKVQRLRIIRETMD